MSKTVTIPTDGMNPFVVISNGVKYVYTPGETVTVPDGVALEIEEYKRWRDKYYGITPAPFGAKPDLSQNDPNAPDFVKNRTHYVEKAFEDITWDGDIEGRDATEVFHSSGYYKVSDQIPTSEALNGATVERFDGVIVEINEDELTQRAEEVLACHNPHVLIISAPTTWEGMSFPSAGVYFWKYDSGAQVMYTHSLKAKETVHKLDPKYLPNAADTADYQERTHWDTRETKEVTFFEETIEMNFSNTIYPCEREIHIGDTVNIYIDGELKHTVTASGSDTQTYINPSPNFGIVITNADHEMNIYNGQYSGLCKLAVVTESGELKQLDEKYIPGKGITVVTLDGGSASMGYDEILECVNKGDVVIVNMVKGGLYFYCGYNDEYLTAYFSLLSPQTRKMRQISINQSKEWSEYSYTITAT